jgi:hypothetical protein
VKQELGSSGIKDAMIWNKCFLFGGTNIYIYIYIYIYHVEQELISGGIKDVMTRNKYFGLVEQIF